MSFRGQCLRALAVVPVAALLAGWGAPAVAQSVPPDQSTTPTTNGLQDLLGKLGGGGTTPPPAPGTPAPAGSASVPAAGSDPGAAPPPLPVAADATTVPGAPNNAVPPDAQAMIDSISRTGGRNTDALLAALRQLVDLGISADEAAVIGMGHFPVAGQAAYSDDFLMPRFTPSFHTHQGNDIFANEGTPVRASEDGSVSYGEDPVSGKDYTLTSATGTYFGCHLVAYADLGSGSRVTQGQIIGFVGNTGDAAGGSPHLHFEIHPGGGAATNPKPILDGWLDEALANVAKLVASYQQAGLPKAISYAGTLRRFDEPLAGGNGIATLLTASGSDPGIRRLTELRAQRGLTNDSSKADAALVDAWKAADQTSRSLLSLVTPGPLQTALVPASS